MKRFAVPVVVIASLLFVVAAVFAAPPERAVTEFDYVELLHDCGDFQVDTNIVFTQEVKAFKNRDGEVIRITEHLNGYEKVYRADDPENYVVGYTSDIQTFTYDPVSGQETSAKFTGSPYNITLPGYGNVYHIAGPFIVDDDGVKEVGLFVVNFEALCAYFES